mmetsp:Transcript_23417/g.54192  ORF Transcript_23417/g.54192 Transcript_23417/m.54192 type:complete len:204 (+) Transcript_23417:358-969(+)
MTAPNECYHQVIRGNRVAQALQRRGAPTDISERIHCGLAALAEEVWVGFSDKTARKDSLVISSSARLRLSVLQVHRPSACLPALRFFWRASLPLSYTHRRRPSTPQSSVLSMSSSRKSSKLAAAASSRTAVSHASCRSATRFSRCRDASAAVITDVPIPCLSIHFCSPSTPCSAAIAWTSSSACLPPSLSGSPTPGGGRFFFD